MTPRTAAWLAVAALVGLCIAVYASGYVPTSSGLAQFQSAGTTWPGSAYAPPGRPGASVPSPKPPQRTPELVNTSTRAPATLTSAVETVVFSGTASWYDVRGLIALPQGPGWKFRVCGAQSCRVLVSTDTGPFVPGRIVDLPPTLFERVCGVPREIGLCPVSLVLIGRSKP